MSRFHYLIGAVEWSRLSLGLCLWSVMLCLFSLEWEWLCWLQRSTEVCQRGEECSRAPLSRHPQLDSVARHSSPLCTLTHTRSNTQPLLPERQEVRPASCDSPLSCGHFLCSVHAIDFLHCSCLAGLKSVSVKSLVVRCRVILHLYSRYFKVMRFVVYTNWRGNPSFDQIKL